MFLHSNNYHFSLPLVNARYKLVTNVGVAPLMLIQSLERVELHFKVISKLVFIFIVFSTEGSTHLDIRNSAPLIMQIPF